MTLLKRLASRSAALVACWLLAGDALAWSTQGHAQIAEAALARLSAPQQAYFERQAAWLVNKERAKKWRMSLNGYSDFAKLSVWPDTRRKLTIEQLFARFGTTVPRPLKPFADQNTYRWHYVNAYYYPPADAKACQLPVTGQLTAAWPKLLASYQGGNEQQRALVLAFIVHLLADANQPLHTMAGLNAECESDAGGNGFCLQQKGKRCTLNLHQLWDRGFGVFDVPLAPPALPAEQGTVITEWQHYPEIRMADHRRLAQRIYGLTPNQQPTARYNAWAQAVVSQRTQQTVSDLTALLRELYEQAH